MVSRKNVCTVAFYVIMSGCVCGLCTYTGKGNRNGVQEQQATVWWSVAAHCDATEINSVGERACEW